MKTIINKRDIKIIAITLIAGILLGWMFFHSGGSNSNSTGVHEHQEDVKVTTYTCSMHPQIKQNEPGLCPICAMDLVPLSTMESDEEDISPSEIQMSESAVKLAEIETTIVRKGVPEKTIHLLGKVQPDERKISELTARFGGRIEKLHVNYTGQNVRKGQRLATIYSPDLLIAQKELIEALKYKESNPSFYQSAKSKMKLWDISDEQIAEIEKKGEPQIYFDVLSPMAGTVTMRHVSLGDYVKEGSALFRVINLKKVWVMFDAYESDLPWIKQGDEIEFTVQSLPGKVYNGIVTYIDPLINATTRVAQVRVEINNSNLILKPEMFANGILSSQIAEKSNELLIPKSSILWTGKRAVVYVKIPNRTTPSFIYREIILGPEAGNFYVVSGGLQEGEEIAINGVFKIDAAAQLAGKPSMMNPQGGKTSTGHDHGEMVMNQEDGDHSSENQHTSDHLEHAMFNVYGNCEMCKERIEDAAVGLDGVHTATWDSESKMIHLNYDPDKVTTADIEQAIAEVGHDTENIKASDEVYEALHECCKYERPEYK